MSNILNDDLAFSVWKNKYSAPGEKVPNDMHERLVTEIERCDKKNWPSRLKLFFKKNKLSYFGKIYSKPLTYYQLMNLFRDFKYIIPQGSIMAMLGRKDVVGSLSNCFVIAQPEDSYGGILTKDQEMVQLMKRRAGVGIDISTLRPSETSVKNAAGTSTGAASFMERYSNSTREVAQKGRRGALMLTIDCRHPDVLEFINAKKDRTKVTGANISVMLRDDFMKAAVEDKDYILRFPCNQDLSEMGDCQAEYNTLYPMLNYKGEEVGYYKRVRAKEIYDAIVENAWENAEPGQIFIDKHWSFSPDGVYPQYRGVTTNPCGEIFMQPYDSCRLIAINLTSYIKDPYTPNARFDYHKFAEHCYLQQRIADTIVDLEIEHIDRILYKILRDPESSEIKATEYRLWQKIREVASSGRRTGCGFTGLGDMLAMMNIKYDSDRALDIVNTIMGIKLESEINCSTDLAILKGTFKGFDKNLLYNDWYTFIKNIFPDLYERILEHGLRNVSFSTVAPTGTVSLMTQTTSGLEPLFQPYYIRRRKINPDDKYVRVDFTDQNGDKWMEYPVLHPKFKDWLNASYSKDQVEMFLINKEALQKSFELSPWYGSTANDINWISRVKLQSIIQQYTTHSISSTINLPETVTKEEVSNIYLESWKQGLKGVTTYRDNCRTGVLVNKPSEEQWSLNNAPKRPKSLPVEVHATVSKGTKWNVIVGLYQNRPYEVFAVPYFTNESNLDLVKKNKGRYDLLKDGEVYSEDITSEMNDEQEVITRLVSTSLRHGADITFIVEQLNKSNGDITSFSKAIARILSKYINVKKYLERAYCNSCESSNIIFEEGCQKCLDCGNSKCG